MRALATIVATGLLAAALVETGREDGAASMSAAPQAAAESPQPDRSGRLGRCPDFRRGLAFYGRSIARWRFQLGARSSRLAAQPRPGTHCRHVRRHAIRARLRSARLRIAFRDWYREAYERWECIHHYEGSWSANTGNGYYGGLQMDWSFMRAYGSEYLARWGHAGGWPVWAQLRTAERARAVRGYWPWPTTARWCGLL